MDISLSSHGLGWEGVLLEKGTSPHFYPTNVSTPYFYFALGLEEALHWEAELDEGMEALITVPGEVWINPPRTAFTHKIDDPCYFVIVAIEESYFFERCPLPTSGRDIRFLNNYNVNDSALKSTIELFLLEVESGGKNGPEYVNSLVSMLSVYYLNNYSDFASPVEASSNDSRFSERELAKIDELIEARLDQPIRVEDMADRLGCSKFYFLREFKKLVGETPYQYLLNHRLERAKAALGSGHQNITATAMALGFNDQSHFTRAFKKRFGVTPGKFKAR